jgi:hypothetical protein
VNNFYTATATTDPFHVEPVTVWDEFLQRSQVRCLAAVDRESLYHSGIVHPIYKDVIDADQLMRPIHVLTGLYMLLSYGSKKWRGRR